MIALIFISNVALANWSKVATFSLNSGQNWTRYATNGQSVSSYKSTNQTYYYVDTYTKSMWTSPTFRLVNSDNEVRSWTVSVAGDNQRAIGHGNTGTVGYNYYASLKPAWNQIGTDTIKLDFDAR